MKKCLFLLVFTLAFSNYSAIAQCITSGSGGNYSGKPGDNIVDYLGEIQGIASGSYFFKFTRSGNFKLNNLRVSVNALNVEEKNSFYAQSGYRITISGSSYPTFIGTETIKISIFDIQGKLVCEYTYKVNLSCKNSFGGFLDANDMTLIADADEDGKDDLVLFNKGGSGTALRVVDLTTKNDINSMSYNTLGGGWNETNDRALIAKLIDPNNPSLKRDFLMLFNTGGSGSALRVIDLTTMNDIKSMSYSTLGGGWNEMGDRALIADANGDGNDDLVLFNTGGSGSALRVIDLTTMNDIKSMSYTMLGGGWNQSGDRALIAKLIDPNNSSLKRDFLVLFNTGGSGSALRVIDLTTMNDIKSMSYTILGGGWNEAGDRALIADTNRDGNDDLVLFNTGGSGSALRVIDLTTMNDIKSMSYTTLGGGWNQAGDRALIADADGDEKDDLVLFNTDYSLSAIALRVINLTTMNDIKTLSYSAQGGGWNDSNDRALTVNVSNDKKVELVLINADYTGMAIQVKDLTTMANFSTIMHCEN